MPAMATATMLRMTTGEGKTTPRSPRGPTPPGSFIGRLDLEAETARGALPLTSGAQTPQAAHQQRLDGQRLRAVDQGVEDLVVTGRRHVELLAYGGLLGPGVLPPLPLELEDLAVALAQAGLLVGPAAGEMTGGVHASTVGDESQRCHSGRGQSLGASRDKSLACRHGSAHRTPRPMIEAPNGAVRWGILGTGRIAHSFARNLQEVCGADIAAVGSRSLAAADAFAAEFGGRPHASYTALVADLDVDIIYVATPHAFHIEHARLAFHAGKHVLCEKPLGLNLVEAEAMVAAAESAGRFLMEGM